MWRVPRIPGITGANASPMFGPDRFAPRLHDVPHEELEAAGIRGLIVDLDNTLLGFRETELGAEHISWVARAHERGFRIVMLSNNQSGRVNQLAAQLQVECIPNALKPLPFGFLRAKRRLDMRRHEIAVVGDQLFTDVLGGKLCGLYTILTEPIEGKDFPVTRFFRFFERLMLARPPMMRLALIGDPVEHSASPALHRGFLEEAGMDGEYVAIRVARGDGARAIRRLRADGFTGCNVTYPLKEEAFEVVRRAAKKRAEPKPSTRFCSGGRFSVRRPMVPALARQSRRFSTSRSRSSESDLGLRCDGSRHSRRTARERRVHLCLGTRRAARERDLPPF